MTRTHLVFFICLLTGTLTGCATNGHHGYWLDEHRPASELVTSVPVPADSGLEYRADSRDRQLIHDAQRQSHYRDPLQTGFQPASTHKALIDYADQLAMELMRNNQQLSGDELVGVTSFVRLNASLREPTVMGNQLAEYLMGELQAFGLGVVDFKLADGISVTPYGDLSLSRKGSDLARSLNMDHIVTGTMIEDGRGVRVNARIIAVDNQRLVASASVYVPAFIIQALVNSPAMSE